MREPIRKVYTTTARANRAPNPQRKSAPYPNTMGKSSDVELQTSFKKIDKDNSGFIDRTDLKKMLHGAVPESKIDMILGYADKDKDGKLSFDEYKKIMKKVEMAKKLLKMGGGSKDKK